MESTQWELAQSLFHQAVELPEWERRAFLHSACGEDLELFSEVFAMLQGDAEGHSILDSGLEVIARHVISARNDVVGLREFGPYKLVRLLGEGGMGVVWLAQREDTGAFVAIKFLPNANLSPARRERFGREIKTLAKLNHPYIARLYDAGTLSDGTPWFVMEYVDGRLFTDFVGERTHTIRRDFGSLLQSLRSSAIRTQPGDHHRDLKTIQHND